MAMFAYQNYSNEKMLVRYEALFSAEKNQVSDIDTIEIASIKDTLNDLSTKLLSVDKTSDTVIKKTYVKNIYIMPSVEEKTSAENTDIIQSVLTNSE